MKVTLKSLAAELKVDPSLISRVLRGDPDVRVSAEKRQLITQVAAQRGYRPNRVARSLQSRETHVIAMLTPDVTNPFHSLMFSGVERVAQKAGYSVILCNTPDNNEGDFQKTLEMMTQGLVDGVLVASARSPDPRLGMLRELGIPFMVLNRPAATSDDDWLGPDDYRTGLMGGNYLTSHGHRRIALLLGDPGIGNMQERERGFLEAMKQADNPEDSYEIVRNLDTKARGVEAAMAMFRRPAERRPTAIFAPHTQLSEAIVEAAFRSRTRIPEDISVLGYTARLPPLLTSVYVPAEEMGAQAMEIFKGILRRQDRPSGPCRQSIEPVIVEAGTVA
ncbi:MAG: LacI family DNA-binding transcriptional regulator [Noviherbaspirillum sp.]